MADFPAVLAFPAFGLAVGIPDPWPAVVVNLGSVVGVGVTLYFKMRALADPGPGYEIWVSVDAADFAGTGAGGPIQGGTAVVAATWQA